MSEPIIDIDLVKDSTMQKIAGAVAVIAANSGGYQIKTPKDIQAIVRAGLADKFFQPGDQIIVEKETAITATVGNSEGETGITAASVSEAAFIAAVGTVHNGDYEFIYNGAEWHYNSVPVSLADYGITITGTAVHGDEVIVHETASQLVFDVIGYDVEEPLSTDAEHSLTLQLHDVYSEMQFDAREALFAFPNGLTAGAYKFTVGAQPWYASDVNKVVTFTLTQAIPNNGVLVLTNGYNATMIGTSIKSYASLTATTEIEAVTLTEADVETVATDLGTVADAISQDGNTNSIQRALLGSNNWKQSALRQYLNSSAAAGSVWAPQTKFDRPPSWAATTAGFLKGIDPEFLSVLGFVKKTTSLNTVTDGGGTEITSEKVFLLSSTEAYFGGSEGTAYPYYSDFSDNGSASTDADTNRIKYRNGTAKYWWLRSPNAGYASGVRYVLPSGALYSIRNAMNSSGVAPACCII